MEKNFLDVFPNLEVGQDTTSIPPFRRFKVFKILFADLISSNGSPVRDTRMVSPIP